MSDEQIREEETQPGDDIRSRYSGPIILNPWHWSHRFTVLILICFLSFGSYLCYDNPGALQDIIEADMNIKTSTYVNFYAWYSWPNVVLSFVGGFLIDRVLGIRLGAIVFAAFVTAGQIVFGLGALANSVTLMTAGRFIFGIGGESLAVAQNTYAVDWFKDKELNLVFGLQLSVSRVGSTVNFWIMQPLYTAVSNAFHTTGYTNLGYTLLFASSFCVLSLLIALLMAYLDRRASRMLGKDLAQTGEVIQFRDITQFPLTFWLITIICVAYYVAVFPFVGVAQTFFLNKWAMTPADADRVNGMVYLISLFGSPVFGFLIDRTGRNIVWVGVGCFVTAACHACLAFTFVNPYIPMVTMGLAYSVLASALWPMVALVIKSSQLGTAYGIMQAVQNLGLGVAALVAGALTDSFGYLILEIFFLNCVFASLVATAVLYLRDASQDGFLNLSSKARALEMKRRIEIEEAQQEKND